MAAKDPVLRIALAQIDTTVGDVAANAEAISGWIEGASDAGAHLVVFPELALSGYPPEDLLLKDHFYDVNARALADLAAGTRETVALVGFPERDGERAYNSLAVLANGRVEGAYRKIMLPNYGVFDERRYFEAGSLPALVDVGGVGVGLTVCEDVWEHGPPSVTEVLAGARLVVNASASPYHRGKGAERERDVVAARARENGCPLALCNAVGGQDELVFDGHSVVVDASGTTLARAGQFREELLICDVEVPEPARGHEASAAATGAEDRDRPAAVPVLARVAVQTRTPSPAPCPLAEPLAELEEVYAALQLGLRDYVEKNRFQQVLVAVSGGVDSALVALLAVDALGPERVRCVVMPSPFSSADTQRDARALTSNLGCGLTEIPIEAGMRAYEDMLGPTGFDGSRDDTAAQNIQARIRGNLMMAISNRSGWLVLTTGNKSEMSVGYATLYGDMAGGFAVIKDVPKTLVYELVRHRNSRGDGEPVPTSILRRPPSAELQPGQLDADSLPPYEALDRILELYVEHDLGVEAMLAEGLPRDLVDEVIAMVDHSEYKRRQAPPGVKVTAKAFGRDRRLPITNRFRE